MAIAKELSTTDNGHGFARIKTDRHKLHYNKSKNIILLKNDNFLVAGLIFNI
jgi:hypothetical protein